MTRLDSRMRSFLVIAVAAAAVGLGAAAGWEAVRAQGHSHSHTHGAADPGGWYKRLSADARAAAMSGSSAGSRPRWPNCHTATSKCTSERSTATGTMPATWGSRWPPRSPRPRAPAGPPRERGRAVPQGAVPQVMDAIKAKDLALFKQRSETMRAACTACHAAERHAFIDRRAHRAAEPGGGQLASPPGGDHPSPCPLP